MTTEIISRLQFAFTISFHILFPAFSIGLILFITLIELQWLITKNTLYLTICKFWTKIFALTFGMGVVSGIVMEYQLGTNWSGFTRDVGGVLGALFTYEVLTAFFVEAGFIGIMVLGFNKVKPSLHFLATVIVLIGTTLSTYWIMCANTWMQHPVGYVQNPNGTFDVASWKTILTNSDLFPRFFHMLLAAYLAAALVISSVSAYYLLKHRHLNFAKTCFSWIWWLILFLIPIQIFLGDSTGLNVFKYQPLKTAAMEGIWQTGTGQPLLLFAIPNQDKQQNEFVIKIPHLASLINTHQWNGKMVGLNSVDKSEQPNVLPVFFSFRLMVGIGFLILFLALTSFYLRIRKRLLTTTWFLKTCVFSSPLGFIALWAGWITAELGRQPWIVYGLVRTKDAVSQVPITTTISIFVLMILVYGIIFGIFYTYFLHRILQKGPHDVSPQDLITDRSFAYMQGEMGEKS
ncbi:MAG: cytochrome ubiquinol oxidase subunit I [Legionellales bacterium]|nr:cytochrome ubiquinol oxidase subunit I [Legionellales bacterium]